MDFSEFWLIYLRAHSKPLTRALHYTGSLLTLAALMAGFWDWRALIAAPIIGYAFAWAGHFGVEGNRPATFGHPVWSLVSDFRMLALFLSGRLQGHLERANIRVE